ncbi:MAG: methionine adenosyltransferase [Thermoplasmataceae archaeon]|jgi:S-adenosylmethionine synthetase|nr:methionine adenosyltransferase [Candidatus Thermoplasmatota archaeon]
MARNISIEQLNRVPTHKSDVEIVERKGIGHPDSICDGIAEAVSRELSKYYLKEYGRVLHHNTDQLEAVGGQSKPKYSGGKILEPSYIILSGRATSQVDGESIPVKSISIGATKNYLKSNFKHLNIDTDVIIDSMIGHGSVDLRGLFDTGKLKSNDTSFGVGFAPLSDTEKLVLATEKYINGDLKKTLPAVGYDVKVMGFREKNTINLTVAAAFVDKYVKDHSEYQSIKEQLRSKVLDNAVKLTDKKVQVFVNTGDSEAEHVEYLTVTGLSMENGDDGSVGRGNRVNGLITPYRAMSMEAAAGKNPVTHVGKLYNVLANLIADDVVKEADGDIEEVLVRIVSQIGREISDPHVASVQAIYASGVQASKYEGKIRSIVDERLSRVSDLTNQFVEGKLSVF